MLDIKEIILNALSQIPWWFIPIIILIFIYKTPWFKGKVGEFLVNKTSDLWLDKNIYTKIKDVTLKLKDDTTTQIDHLIISKYGIFVIETKNYKGWIYGNEKQKEWTQVNFKQKHKFQNPLNQNYRHIKALEEVLEVDVKKFISVIAFVGESMFKTEMPKNVCKGNKYIDYIQSFDEEILNQTEIENIINKIETKRLKNGFKTDREHVKNLRENRVVR